MTATPITVAISTLNRRNSLERTLVALREQTYPRFEVVVVNGPSTDGTTELLERFADRARVFDCPTASIGRSRNISVQQAAGDIVAFIDDDAIPPPDWLERLVAPFEDERVGYVGGPVFDVPLDRVEWKICTSTRLGAINTDSSGPIAIYQGLGADPVAYFAGCNMGLRRNALQAIGGFNSALLYTYEDVDVCCHMNDAGYSLAYLEEVTVRHDRAVNSVRDGQRVITDPYALVLGRIVFTLHCKLGSKSRAKVRRLVRDWERDWVAHSTAHLTSGRFTPAEHEKFVARVVAGTTEGIARGSLPRPFTTIGPPPTGEFRQYG
jgi:glycosyltransferase involved in cell wall biosynthesis